jgi:hypothetical protein
VGRQPTEVKPAWQRSVTNERRRTARPLAEPRPQAAGDETREQAEQDHEHAENDEERDVLEPCLVEGEVEEDEREIAAARIQSARRLPLRQPSTAPATIGIPRING